MKEEMIVNERPPEYYAPIQSQLDLRCYHLCRKMVYIFAFIILCSLSALGILLIRIQEEGESDEVSIFSWILCSHFCMLLLFSGYGIISAKKQKAKNFKIILCFTAYLAIIGPFHRCFQIFDSEMDSEDLLARHLADNLSLIFTLLSWFTFIPVSIIHFAFKQSEYFSKTGILIFPEGTYNEEK
uniref:Transmembrane protein n=1 Tax=Panagrolaimus sp. PS1159 TaxID=55785 RepID=A0AC35ETQ4_9BILA